MNKTYSTKILTEEQRKKAENNAFNGAAVAMNIHFDECEDCKNQNIISHGMEVRFYPWHKRALCDACIDHRDGFSWRKGRVGLEEGYENKKINYYWESNPNIKEEWFKKKDSLKAER